MSASGAAPAAAIAETDLQRQITVAELLNRVLDRGVVITGDVVISVAGVDLVYLGLRAVLSSTETLRGSTRTRHAVGAERAVAAGDAAAGDAAAGDAAGAGDAAAGEER